MKYVENKKKSAAPWITTKLKGKIKSEQETGKTLKKFREANNGRHGSKNVGSLKEHYKRCLKTERKRSIVV